MKKFSSNSHEFKKLSKALKRIHVELKALADISPEDEPTCILSALLSVPALHQVTTKQILKAFTSTGLWDDDWSVSITYATYTNGGVWPL